MYENFKGCKTVVTLSNLTQTLHDLTERKSSLRAHLDL